jgi:hypothetical protein
LKLYSETSTNYNGGDDKFMMGNFLLLVIVLDNWKTVVIIFSLSSKKTVIIMKMLLKITLFTKFSRVVQKKTVIDRGLTVPNMK